MEAMTQAFLEMNSALGIEEGKAKVEWIGPDIPEYWARMLGNTAMHLDIMKRNAKRKP